MAVIVEKRNLCGLVIDAVIEESHSVSSTITDHPVSSGSPISDHAYRGPLTLTIRGIIGTTPPKNYIQGDTRPDNLLDSPIARATEEPEAFNQQVNTTGITHFGSKKSQFNYDNPNSRISAAWERLIELQDNKEVCQVVSGLKVYDEMVVQSVEASQNAENCDKLDFTVTLKEIRRVRTQETTVVSIGSKGVKDRGDQKPECLSLNQVFTVQAQQADAPYLAVGNSSLLISRNNSIEERGEAGVFSPFTSEAYEKFICGGLIDRFQGKTFVNQVGGTFAVGAPTLGGIYASSVSESVIVDELVSEFGNLNALAKFAKDACEILLQHPSCEFSKACGENRFTGTIEDGQSEAVDGTSIKSVEKSSSPTLADSNQRNIAEQEKIAADPTQQLYAQTLRKEFAQEITLKRLQCYQEEVVNAVSRLTFNGNDLDKTLTLIGFGTIPPSFPNLNEIPQLPPKEVIQ